MAKIPEKVRVENKQDHTLAYGTYNIGSLKPNTSEATILGGLELQIGNPEIVYQEKGSRLLKYDDKYFSVGVTLVPEEGLAMIWCIVDGNENILQPIYDKLETILKSVTNASIDEITQFVPQRVMDGMIQDHIDAVPPYWNLN